MMRESSNGGCAPPQGTQPVATEVGRGRCSERSYRPPGAPVAPPTGSRGTSRRPISPPPAGRRSAGEAAGGPPPLAGGAARRRPPPPPGVPDRRGGGGESARKNHKTPKRESRAGPPAQ